MFKVKDKEAIADVAIEVESRDLNELFEDAAKAVLETIVNPMTVEEKITKKVELTNDKVDRLLYDWLEEILYLIDTETLLFSHVKASIKIDSEFVLYAELKGDKIKPEEQDIRSEVKAITMHMFKVTKEKETWKAKFVLDL